MTLKHKFFYGLFRPLVVLFLKIKFNYKYEVAKDLPEKYIVLSNHVTDFDPLFVASSFKRQMYFVGSEHIARWKVAYKFLKFAFDPIIRYKGTVAGITVIDMLRKIKDGANVCLFAEGIRTWDGVTCPVLPSTGKMIKRSGAALVTYKIIGGYFVSPGWSVGKTRRGYIHGAPVHVYTKEDLAKLSVDEINEIIKNDLYENAYERQLVDPKKYRGKNLAEKLENLLFICPKCGSYESISSKGNDVICKECGYTFSINEYGMLENCEYKTVFDLNKWILNKVIEDVKNDCSYITDSAKLYTINNHVEELVAEGRTTINTNAITCGDITIQLSDITTMDIHGRNAIVFSVDKVYYELIPDLGYNAIKYLLYFRQVKNISQ